MKASSLITAFNRRSLVGRFFIASLFMLPLFIAISASLLLNSFYHSQINAEQEQLQSQLYLLLGLTEIRNKQLSMPPSLPEPRFNQQNSGLYALVFNAQGQEQWRSESAKLLPSTSPSNQTFIIDQLDFFSVRFGESELLTVTYDIEWIDDEDNIYPLRFVVMKDDSTIDAKTQAYRNRLFQWLGFMSVALIIIQALIMRWGLTPLKILSKQLNALKNHDIDSLSTNYPSEIQPVIDNLNNILEQEKKQRERYRNSLTDLAHSLKTPLAVITSELEKDSQKHDTVNQQLLRINQIVTHQLQRAVIRSTTNSVNHMNNIQVYHTVDRLCTTLRKVYNNTIELTNNCAPDIFFKGDESDLLEALGNILDNACKYGNGKVCIDCISNESELIIRISDNGDGIPETIQKDILKRGARADTMQTGQGIGLTMTADIISSYGGGISIHNNIGEPHLAGACFTLSFPL